MRSAVFFIVFFCWGELQSQEEIINITTVDSGWAANSINTVIFRKNALVTYKNIQYIAYYDGDGYMVLGKRKTHSRNWQLQRTVYKGNVKDAHNSISIMTDGKGYLHVAWDHHNSTLNYARTTKPGSLQLGERKAMTGYREASVTYPEFYWLPEGDLLFLYRDGVSGKGNLVINKYNLAKNKWDLHQQELISGEDKRNAYWQACVDKNGVIHLSWVWRETPDVSSNHDLCYAKSLDGGKTWLRSDNSAYNLPITASTAEYITRIPPNSELINQTAMTTDEYGRPFIATYWKQLGDSIPQYQLIYQDESKWNILNSGFRTKGFSLQGTGTKRIPVSRPQVITFSQEGRTTACIIYRDQERGNRVSIAICDDLTKNKWLLKDLWQEDLGSWEPCYDTELWKNKRQLSLFVQKTDQADAEGQSGLLRQAVKVLEWRPLPVQ